MQTLVSCIIIRYVEHKSHNLRNVTWQPGSVTRWNWTSNHEVWIHPTWMFTVLRWISCYLQATYQCIRQAAGLSLVMRTQSVPWSHLKCLCERHSLKWNVMFSNWALSETHLRNYFWRAVWPHCCTYSTPRGPEEKMRNTISGYPFSSLMWTVFFPAFRTYCTAQLETRRSHETAKP